MARATTRTLLSLDRWATLLGIDPLHFNQVTTTKKPSRVCGTPWKQWAWQESQQVGREDVANTILEAEQAIHDLLGYKVLPTWEVSEKHVVPKPLRPGMLNLSGLDISGFWAAIQSQWAHYISGGVETKTLIVAGTAVVYTDADGDGYFETATLSFPTAVTDPNEIAVYYPGQSGSDAWEIRPLRSVSFAAGVCTVRMWRHQLPLAALLEALEPVAIDGDVPANFLTTVDVYRHWNDPQTQATVYWAALGSECGCGSSSCPACCQAYQTVCLSGKDYRNGIISYRPALWNAVTGQFDSQDYAVQRSPDRIELFYRAGWVAANLPSARITMDPFWERAVAYYSLALLDRPLCGCDNLEVTVRHWSEDLALNAERGTYQLSRRVLDNPLGTTRGALYAWDRVNAPGRMVPR